MLVNYAAWGAGSTYLCAHVYMMCVFVCACGICMYTHMYAEYAYAQVASYRVYIYTHIYNRYG